MLKAGVHLGHVKSKNHTAMRPYIFTVRNTISVLDLTKTLEKLDQTLNFLKETTAQGGMVLLVGTRPAARQIVAEVAQSLKMPYVTERWIGGLLTNFRIVGKRIEYMESLEKERAAGGFEKYTKGERLRKDTEIEKLHRFFDSLRLLKKMPSAVFVVDINQDETAVLEAQKMKIPTIALVDTNSNINLVDWPIPSNDDALPAVKYMVSRVGQAIGEGQKIFEDQKAISTQPPQNSS